MATDPDDVNDYWMEREAAKKINALFANRIYVQPIATGMVRLNFGEMLDEYDPTYHTAIVLTAEEAVSFAVLIHRIGTALLSPPPIIQTVPAEDADNGD